MSIIQASGAPIRRLLTARETQPIMLAALRSAVFFVLTLIVIFVVLPAALGAA